MTEKSDGKSGGQTTSTADAETLAKIDAYIEAHLQESLDDLTRLATIPSVSSKGEGIDDAANMVASLLNGTGFAAQVLPTTGNPVVFAEAPGKGGKTLICYNHYDVQPPEPLDLWTSPPFEPTIRDGRMYARGVSDDKGQLISRIAAMRAVRAVLGDLPCKVKFLVEGEEEISSPSLEPFVEQHRDLLAADACVWEFGGVDHDGRPQMVLGLRGILYVEYHVRTMTRDAHSGGAHNFPNAAWRLVYALGTIRDQNGHILVPGWYDDVRPPTARELELRDTMPSNEQRMRDELGIKEFVNGHTGRDYLRAVYNPTANIAGLSAGWEGKGSKTVTPASAMAKMDFRLVQDQDPDDLLRKLRAHLDAQGFSDVELVRLGGERAATTPPDDPFVQLAIRTAEAVYGQPAVIDTTSGGSGPNYAFRAHLGTPIVTLGPGDEDSKAHAPDESMSIERFVQGTKHMAHLLLAYAAQQ